MKQLKKLKKIFRNNPHFTLKYTPEDAEGNRKPILRYKNRGFLSPSKMLAYKAKQSYNPDNVPFEAALMAIRRARKYHTIFEIINNNKTLNTIDSKRKSFMQAVETIYKEYELKPLVGEYPIWSEHNYTMAIPDAICIDKNGNYVIVELKTMESMDAKKELLALLQCYVSKTILEQKLNVKNVKTYTLKWSHQKELMEVIENQEGEIYKTLLTHFENIVKTESLWETAIQQIKTKKIKTELKERKEKWKMN